MSVLPAGRKKFFTSEQREGFIRDGYVVARGLLPKPIVDSTRDALLRANAIEEGKPETWASKIFRSDHEWVGLTNSCRTAAVEEAAEELVGSRFLRGKCYSPYMASVGEKDPWIDGYIPILNYPGPGEKVFEKPTTGWHIDGMSTVTLWPKMLYLIIFPYLSDVPDYGGATCVLPGSHRQLFEHWCRAEQPATNDLPQLAYKDPIPLPGKAGDVVFMHYLLIHSGSANHADRIRVGLNSGIMPDQNLGHERKTGRPAPDWTPMDWTLRTDNLGG